VCPQLIETFEKKCSEMKSKYKGGGEESKYILAFHGTAPQNIESIMTGNFRMDKVQRGEYGTGIYFSEFLNISIGYGGPRGNKLIISKILPGCTLDVSGSNYSNKPLAYGYDSHRVNKDQEGRACEIVIANSDQILFMYVINLA